MAFVETKRFKIYSVRNRTCYFDKNLKLIEDKGIRQIRAGKNHSAAWTCPSRAEFDGGPVIGSPQKIPPKYDVLENESIEDCRLRLRQLHRFNETLFRCWKFLNITNQSVSFHLFLIPKPHREIIFVNYAMLCPLIISTFL